MKKLISIFCAILIFACMLTSLVAYSADSDFVIEDGVLISYNGTSSDVTIPSSVYSIGDSAFLNNKSIKSLKLHSNVYTIGNKAFYGCTSLSAITGGDGVSYVGALAFVDTKFLTQSTDEFLTLGSVLVCCNSTKPSVSLPNGITAIAPYAFLRNTSITSFSADDDLKTIGEGAFYECTSLSTVSVSGTLSFVGADAFCSTKWLSNAGDFAILGDILISYKGSSQKVTIPTNIRQLAPNAFYFNSTVTDVTIPASVFSIGARSFFNCTKLKSVTMSEGLAMIGEEAFANCSALLKLETPSSLSKISKGAFINCTKMSIAFLRGNGLVIDYGAFANTVSMESVLLSDGVRSVGDSAFSGSGLSYITIPSDVLVISSTAFAKCSNMTVICDKDSFANSALNTTFATVEYRGDAGIDGEVDITDATRIQRYLALMDTFTNAQLAFADADFDAIVTVLDVTYIQRAIAKML